jgi:hypothetical protein
MNLLRQSEECGVVVVTNYWTSAWISAHYEDAQPNHRYQSLS